MSCTCYPALKGTKTTIDTYSNVKTFITRNAYLGKGAHALEVSRTQGVTNKTVAMPSRGGDNGEKAACRCPG